jgi:hypothetical protein
VYASAKEPPCAHKSCAPPPCLLALAQRVEICSQRKMAEPKVRSDKARPDKTGPWEQDRSGRLRRDLEIKGKAFVTLIPGVLALKFIKGVQYIQWDNEKGSVVKRGPSTAVQLQSYAHHEHDIPLGLSLIVAEYLDLSAQQAFRHLQEIRGTPATAYPQIPPL